MDDVSRSAAAVKTTMRDSSFDATSFGLLNVPLGAAVSALANQAKALTHDLDMLAHRLARNTSTLEKSWQGAEQDVIEATAKTREQIDDPEEVSDSCGPETTPIYPKVPGGPSKAGAHREGGSPAWQEARWGDTGEGTVYV